MGGFAQPIFVLAFSQMEKKMTIETRPFPVNYWTQIKTRKLSPSARAVGAFFWANKFTSLCGVYFIDPGWIASCTGYDESTIDLHIDDLSRHAHVEYDQETCEVLIIDWFRYHKFNGHWKKVLKADIDKIESPRLNNLALELAIKFGHIDPTKPPKKEDTE